MNKYSTRPVFTILTATFNHEHYIDDCILSAVNQTFSDWEMIILDDGSTDQTGEICREWVNRDYRIKYYFQPNRGIFHLHETNNKGLALSRGKYLSILEGDDKWLPDKLAKQYRLLEEDPSAVLCWGRINVFASGSGQVLRTLPDPKLPVPSSWNNEPYGTILKDLLFDNFIGAVSITFRKSVLEEIGGFQTIDGFPGTDYPTLLKMAVRGKFIFCPDVLSQYRTYSKQISKEHIRTFLVKRIQYNRQFVGSLSEDIKSVIGVNPEQLNRHLLKQFPKNHLVSGRHELVRKEFLTARKSFLNVMFYPNTVLFTWRIMAFAGFLLSLVHADMELFAKLLRLPVYDLS